MSQRCGTDRVMGLVALAGAGLLLLGLLSPAPTLAQSTPDQLLFGPRQYLRTTGIFNEYTDMFTIPVSVGSPLQLHIVNGEANGSNRISSGWVNINGVQVAGPSDFGQNVAIVDKTITLAPGTNTLYVRAAGSAGSYLTISIFGTAILPTPASLTPNPLHLTVGATGALTATLSPVPTQAGTLNVSNSNTSVATVPVSIVFGVNQTNIPVPVTAMGTGQVQITVSLNGGSATSTVQVQAAPPTVASLAPPTLTLTQGSTGTLTVSINAAQSTPTMVTLTSSALGVASVPGTVEVSSGHISAPITVSANTSGDTVITASLNGTSASSTVTVTPAPPTIASLQPPTLPITLGASGILTVTISATRPTDTLIHLSAAPVGIVTVPATVPVLAGQLSATIPVGTVALGTAMVQVSLNSTSAESAVSVVVPPAPAVIALQPPTSSVVVGATGQLTVTLNAAQLTNTDVTLMVDQPGILQVPPTVTVLANQTQAVFTVTGLAVGDAIVTASIGTSSKQATIHVIPPPPVPVSLLPNPLPLQQGATGTLTLTINAAQLSDTVVPLINSNTNIIQIPANVTVPAGQLAVTVPVTALLAGTATITTALTSVTVSSTVQVSLPPPVVTSLTPATLSLPKGKPGILRVTISRASMQVEDVTVTSSAPGVALVPVMVPVPAGALFADFPVMSLSEGTATITAALNGDSATSTVMVTPAEVVTLTLSPLNAAIFVGETQPFTATATYTDGNIQNVTSQVTWTSSNEAVAAINSGGLATALAVGTTTITASIINPSGPPPVTASTELTVQAPPQVQIIPSSASLKVGETLSLTLDAGTPAGVNGLTVTLASTGTGSVTHPATVTFLVGEVSAPFIVTGVTAGTVTLTASATGRQSATAMLTVTLAVPVIANFSPTSGQVGTTVTLTGTNFDPTAANNVVKFNGVLAAVTAATGTTITTTVPGGATTGLISVTNAGGTGSSTTAFTVINSPPALMPIGNQTVALGTAHTLTVAATDPNGDNVTFAITPLPLPPHAAFDAQTGVFTFTPDATQVGTFTFTFTASDSTQTSSETITVTVTGGAPTDPTSLTGTVDNTSLQPLANLAVALKGTSLTAVTDSQGRFTLANIPANRTGRQQVVVTGFAAGYANLVAPVDINPNVVNQLASPLTLPPVDMSTAVTVNPNATTVVQSPTLNVSMAIPPNTAKNANGTLYTGVLTISPVPEYGRAESRPVELRPGISITIQPAGITLDPPVPLTMPNVDNMAPGNELDLWSLSPDSGTFYTVGRGRVSADGQRIETINGGVRKTAWHFFLARLPATGTSGNQDQEQGECHDCALTASSADIEEGALSEDIVIPGVRSFGASRDLTLYYRSTNADVKPIVPVDVTLPAFIAVPNTFSVRLSVGSLDQGSEQHWDAHLLPETSDSISRLGISWDATALSTGRYPYRLTLFSNYGQSAIGAGSNRFTLVRNERASPLGAGWTLASVDRLYPQTDGALVLARGTGATLTFEQDIRPLVIESYGTARAATIAGVNHSFVAGTGYAGAKSDLLNPVNFGASGIIKRPVQFRSGITIITPALLAGVDIFVITLMDQGQIGDLLPSEVVALEQFVNEGGALLETRSQGSLRPALLGTLASPTQFVCSGLIAAFTSASLTNPVRVGPFGTPSTLTMGCNVPFAVTGAFSNLSVNQLGPNFITLRPGAEFGGLGRAVLIGDEDIFASNLPGFGAFYTPNTTLFLNTIAFLAQAPGYKPAPAPPSASPTYVGPAGEFSKITKNPDGTFTRTLKDGTAYQFNAQGLQTAMSDRNSNTTTYVYDAQNRLTTITDPAGLVTTFAYSGTVMASVTDAANRVTRFEHDVEGNLTRVVYADASQQTLVYDPQHRLIQRTDARNQVYQYAYDFAGRFTQVTLPSGETRKVSPSQRIAVPNMAAGEGTPSNPALLAPATNGASFTDAANNTTTFELNTLGRVTKQTDPLNRTTNIVRDSQGNPTTITRPNGAVTTMTYDSKGNLLTTTEQAIAATTTFTYEATFNQVTSIKDPLNHTTTMTYDVKGNPLTITDADNKVTTLTYDSRGLLLMSKDALNQTTTFTYDAQGQLLTKTDPLNRTITLAYDAAGNVATSTDALNRVTTFTYDAFNRLKTVTDPATGVTTYTYDGNGNLVSVKDVKNQTTTFVYDNRNRLSSTTDPLGKTESYTYDGADNLLIRITPKNETISFAYDAANQLLGKTLPGGLVTSYMYDSVGNLTGVTDPDSNLTMTYDLTNRLLTVSTAGSSNQPSVTLTYTYDKNGNRLTLNDGSSSNTYVYDVLNRLTSLTSPAGATTYAYDALSRRSSTTLPNGTQTTYAYDVASQVTNILHQITATSTQINEADYVYNNVGNRTSLTNRRGVQAFGYDNLDRLTSASHPLLGTPQAFSYDAVGNRTTGGSVYNAGNQLTEDANFLYQYDANGNQTNKTNKTTNNSTVYTYDAENRLVKVEEFVFGNPTPVATSTYRYDGLGRRIEKVGNGQTRRYVYDGEDILLEYDGANALLARYTHGSGIDEPIAMARGGSNFFYHQDDLGSVTDLTDSTGSTGKTYSYDAYGNILEQTGTVENPYTYTGREFDSETGLHYYRARYYDSIIGRFLQKDPVGFTGGINMYVYVKNNPVKYLDPMGLYEWYGNYGGPDWTGGQKEPYDPSHEKKYLPPKDSQDACYRDHDICYYKCRQAFCDCGQLKMCFKGCDRELSRCLRNLETLHDPSYNTDAKRAADYFAIRNPGCR